ncbi:hypothetical protein ACQCN2_13545 [Brevibacillus ginsengisoli]|uniref:hypothetical protein n=1 Tax=Brevibacillus ginsengisoli TaxID=363854 RepID=UPI003CF75C7D
MTAIQKRWMFIGIVILAIVAGVLIYKGMQDKSPMVPLLSYDLKQKQVTQVEDYLKKNHYEFELKDKKIYVHESKAEEILVNMSAQGIPSP